MRCYDDDESNLDQNWHDELSAYRKNVYWQTLTPTMRLVTFAISKFNQLACHSITLFISLSVFLRSFGDRFIVHSIFCWFFDFLEFEEYLD